MSNSYPVNNYYYNPPYNHWAGGRSDSLNKWKINYKGSIAKASDLPNEGEFKGDTYNVLEDGSNYMWNGSSWDKLDANVYIGATSTKNGIQGLVPPALPSEKDMFLKGDGTYGIPVAGLTDIRFTFECNSWGPFKSQYVVEYYANDDTILGSSEVRSPHEHRLLNNTSYIYIVLYKTYNITTNVTIKNYISEKIYANEIVDNKYFSFTKDENSTHTTPAYYYEGEISNVDGTNFTITIYEMIPFNLRCELYNETTLVNTYNIDMSCIANYIDNAIAGVING